MQDGRTVTDNMNKRKASVIATTFFAAGRGQRRRKRLADSLMEAFIRLNGFIAIGLLLGMLALLLRNGLPAFNHTSPWEFLSGSQWRTTSQSPAFGIAPLFVSTLWVSGISTALAVPIGVACAVYLAEAARPAVRELVKPVVELLSGIPSVVIGFIGLALLSPYVQGWFNLKTGLCGLTAAIMLSLMSLPIIVSVSEDALHAVPHTLREASLALGATRWETIIHVCLPGAASGIAAAVMLGAGRAIGETMTVLMLAGGALALPHSPTDPMMPMTATIASEIGNATHGSPQYHALFAIGIVLFTMTLFANLIASAVLKQQRRKFTRT